METERCDRCGGELFIGSFPFCNGDPEDHETVRSRWAQDFEPVVVFRAPDGRTRVPGRGDAPTPKGYERVELRTRRELDAFCRREAAREGLKAEGVRLKEDLFFGRDLARNRAEVKKLAEGADGPTRGLIETICREMDRRDAARRRFDPGIYFEAFE